MGVLMDGAEGRNGEPPDLVEMVEGMTYNVGSAVMALWRGDLRIAAWHVNREMTRLQGARNAETTAETLQSRLATIRAGRWTYAAEISPEGIASYENRTGDVVHAEPGRYKVIRYH